MLEKMIISFYTNLVNVDVIKVKVGQNLFVYLNFHSTCDADSIIYDKKKFKKQKEKKSIFTCVLENPSVTVSRPHKIVAMIMKSLFERKMPFRERAKGLSFH